jgi:hypothetical protein
MIDSLRCYRCTGSLGPAFAVPGELHGAGSGRECAPPCRPPVNCCQTSGLTSFQPSLLEHLQPMPLQQGILELGQPRCRQRRIGFKDCAAGQPTPIRKALLLCAAVKRELTELLRSADNNQAIRPHDCHSAFYECSARRRMSFPDQIRKCPSNRREVST